MVSRNRTISIFIICSAENLLKGWLGSSFPTSVIVTQLLVVGVTVNMLTGLGTSIIRGIGKPIYETQYAVISLLLNIILGIGLAQIYGFWGIVIATPISVSIGSIFFIVRFHMRYSIPLLKFCKTIYLKPFIICTLAGITLYTLNAMVQQQFVITTRLEIITLLIFEVIFFFFSVIVILKKVKYWDENDKAFLVSVGNRSNFLKKLIAFSL